MKNLYEKILFSKNYKNAVVVVAVGKKLEKDWKNYSMPNLKKYCSINKINLILIKKPFLEKKSIFYKSLAWHRLLVGDLVKKNIKTVQNICLLDCDILANPFAPNIFKEYQKNKIALISMHKNLPYDYKENRKKISYYRKLFYNKKLPLDSMIHAGVSQKYSSNKLKIQKDYACIGVIVFNVKNHSDLMKKWFFKYKKGFFTTGGMQTILNFEMLNYNKIQWLEYKFQALWANEMAWRYPFLYKLKGKKNKIILDCINFCLFENYFLHFAGGWYENDMWKMYKSFKDKTLLRSAKFFQEYLKKKITPKNYGRILPSNRTDRLKK